MFATLEKSCRRGERRNDKEEVVKEKGKRKNYGGA